jgi:hypothetical protein
MDYANWYWDKPCKDGRVFLAGRAITITEERKKWGAPESDWNATFLADPTSTKEWTDGLFFIRNIHDPKTFEYDADRIPMRNLIKIEDWTGIQSGGVYGGLNDCAHFVSECMRAGGISVYSADVGTLLHQLGKLPDTKTLASLVSLRAAKRIVDHADIMKKGDVIAFGSSKGYSEHAHSTVYIGDGSVANHTHLNHRDYPRREGGRHNWTNYADTYRGHDLVTLIHFGHDDPAPSISSWIFGWWRLEYRNGFTFYDYFGKDGRAYYTTKAPTDLKKAPPLPAKGVPSRPVSDQSGFWFAGSPYPGNVKVCWTATGTYEDFWLSGWAVGSDVTGVLVNDPSDPKTPPELAIKTGVKLAPAELVFEDGRKIVEI